MATANSGFNTPGRMFFRLDTNQHQVMFQRITVRGQVTGVLRITNTIAINESEICEEFIRASGPGGQNVNKVATAVQLRFDVANSASLPDDVRKRLVRLSGRRVTGDGILIIDARRFRTRERNRQDAIDRLFGLIRRAAEKPKIRRRTKPPLATKIRRLESKRRTGETKRKRRPVSRSAKKGSDYEILD